MMEERRISLLHIVIQKETKKPKYRYRMISETISFIERLNGLAIRRKNDALAFDIFKDITFFNRDAIDNWSLKIESLYNDLKQLDHDDDIFRWFKDLLIEIFTMLVHENFRDLCISASGFAQLLNKLFTICDARTIQAVGKLYISVSSAMPQFINNPLNETRLIELTEALEPIHMEIFKFSWLSTKLSERKQTILLRHLLKKSKYELQKFNLLSENATGFAQLSVLFINYYRTMDFSDEHVDHIINEMYHIMGKYSLESMRCLDVFLLISSEHIMKHYLKCINFLRRTNFIKSKNVDYNNIMLSNVVLFNLQQNDNEEILSNYWHMISILVKFGLLDYKQLWDNISPDSDNLSECLDKLVVKLEEESTKGADNALAMAAALTNEEDDDVGYNPRDKDTKDKENTQTSHAPSEDKKKVIDKNTDEIEMWRTSKKIQFLKCLAIHGCYGEVVSILREQPRLVLLDNEISQLLARCIEYMIEPLYQMTPYRSKIKDSKLCKGLFIHKLDTELVDKKPRLFTSRKTFDIYNSMELNVRFTFYFPEWTQDIAQLYTVDELFQFSHEILSILGPSLACSPILVTKLVRIGINDIHMKNDLVEETTNKWIDYVRKFILPTISSYNPSHSYVTTEIYNLMKLFSYEKRYFMYNEMLTKLSQDSLPIKVAFNKAEREVKSILKALSIDNIAKESRNLSNLISSNPLATLLHTVKQIENYDKVSELVIYTTKFFNEFSYDVLQYILLLRLTYRRSAVQFDGVNQAPWVLRLAIFISGLAKNCTQMNLSNIVSYIIKMLHNNDNNNSIIAISIMKELISTVGGIRDQNEVTFKNLIMLNSGEPLKQEARKLIYDSRDSNVEVAQNLVSLFVKENSISEIILLLYNLNLKANTTQAHYKILSSRCDEMNTLLWSFIELVKFCCKDEKFVENVLPFHELTSKFHVSAPWAFDIWRDYIDKKEHENENITSDQNLESSTSFKDIIEKANFQEIDFTNLSRDLFITFWKLSLYDIHLDKSIYDELKGKFEELEAQEASNRKRNTLNNKVKRILLTFIAHQRTFNQTKKLLNEKAQRWLKESKPKELVAFLQYAIIPRVLFSPSDAIFSAFFILQSFDLKDVFKIFGYLIHSNILETLLFSCTSTEAGNLGTFFFTMFEWLEKTRKEQNTLDNLQTRELYQWHSKIVKQVISCLSCKNYMSIRNGIEFMKHISSIFPVITTHLKMISVLLENNLLSEEREDIKLPTNALLGHLKARLKNNSINLQDFCILTEQELKEKEQYELELEEIQKHETALANEQKQIEIRKKLELNKLERDQKQKQQQEPKQRQSYEAKDKDSADNKFDDLPKAPSNSKLMTDHQEWNTSPGVEENESMDREWSMSKVLRRIEDTAEALQVNDVDVIFKIIPDNQAQNDLKRITSDKNIPLQEYRDGLFTILSSFFKSMMYNPQNPDFVKQLRYLKNAVSYANNQDVSAIGGMYDEDLSTGPKKISRYNNTMPSAPKNVAPKDTAPVKLSVPNIGAVTSSKTSTSTTQNKPAPLGPASQSVPPSKHNDRNSTRGNERSSVNPRSSSSTSLSSMKSTTGGQRYGSYSDSRGSKTGGKNTSNELPSRFAPPRGPNRSNDNRDKSQSQTQSQSQRSNNSNSRNGNNERLTGRLDDRFSSGKRSRDSSPRDYNENHNKKRNMGQRSVDLSRDHRSFGPGNMPSQPQSSRGSNRYDTGKQQSQRGRNNTGNNGSNNNRNDKARLPQGPKSQGSRYQR